MEATTIDKLTEIFGEVEWKNDDECFCVCPGEEHHTTDNHLRDCKIYLNGTPTVHCLHNGSRDPFAHRRALRMANTKLRSALRGKEWKPGPKPKRTAEEKARRRREAAWGCNQRKLARNKNWVIETYAWPVDSIRKDSPLPIVNDWAQILELFDGEDIIWVGGVKDTGSTHHCANFRRVNYWASLAAPPQHFICGSTFKPGSNSRCDDNVDKRKYVIVECDKLHADPKINQDMTGAILNFIRTQYNWNLRSVVTSGKKSVHGWFDFPGEDEMAWAEVAFEGLGVDIETMARPYQPVRAPGITRKGGSRQNLLWKS